MANKVTVQEHKRFQKFYDAIESKDGYVSFDCKLCVHKALDIDSILNHLMHKHDKDSLLDKEV